jgi:hypothetical protein
VVSTLRWRPTPVSSTRGLLALAVVLCLVACSPESADPQAADGGSAESSPASPLTEFMGWDARAELAKDRARRYQELIATCMAEAGFTYLPVLPDARPADTGMGGDEEARLVELGLGISTVIDRDPEAFRYAADGPEDPNAAVVETLDDAERQEYLLALRGPSTDPWGGCAGEASERVSGDTTGVAALWESLSPALQEMEAAVVADARIVAALADWRTCMADAGFGRLQNPDEVWSVGAEEIRREFERLIGGPGAMNPFADMTVEQTLEAFSSMTDEEIEAAAEARRREVLATIDRDALARLQDEEIALALADFRCRRIMVDAELTVRAEHEARFVDDHRDVLMRIRDLADR